MEGKKERYVPRAAAAALALALFTAGCAGPETAPNAVATPTQTAAQETERAQVDAERLAMQKAAEEKWEGYRWPRESVWKTILGKEAEFVRYHGNGWTMDVPADWEETSAGMWDAPSKCASFTVSKQFLGVNNPKAFRAQQGAWKYETDYAPPFDYYYDDDGGYTPPAGSADYIYFFAPDGENQSYEFSIQTVVGKTSEEEKAIQEAMLLSFSLDETSHVLHTDTYTPGETEWDAAMAGLMAEQPRLWFSWYHDGTSIETDGKGNPDYLSYVLELENYYPEEFTQSFFGEKPEGAEVMNGEPITLCLPEMGIWLYFHDDSPWVQIYHAGEAYWAKFCRKDDPDKLIFDAARSWLEAESGWMKA